MGCEDGIEVICEGEFLSLILQKQGEEDGWIVEKAGLGETGILVLRSDLDSDEGAGVHGY